MSSHQTETKQNQPVEKQQQYEQDQLPLPAPDQMRWFQLQRTLGNAAIQRLVADGKLEPPASLTHRFPHSLLQRTPDQIGDVHITGTQTLTGDLYVEGDQDSEDRRRPVASHLRGIHASDANQGNLGDCFVVAPLAAIAYQNPQAIFNAIQDNHDGTFTVTLYHRVYNEMTGWQALDRLIDDSYTLTPHTYQVTPEVLTGTTERTTDLGGGVAAITTHPAEPHVQPQETTTDTAGNRQTRNELWAVVMERAFAIYMSGSTDTGTGYARLGEGGTTENMVMEAVTGQQSTEYFTNDVTLRTISDLFDRFHAITLSTREDLVSSVLLAGHSYYLVGVDLAQETVTVRNPHSWDRAPVTATFSANTFQYITTNPATTGTAP